MPTFQVTDPNTGQTVRLTGDSPPSEQELEQIFATMQSTPIQAPQISAQQETPDVTRESFDRIPTDRVGTPVQPGLTTTQEILDQLDLPESVKQALRPSIERQLAVQETAATLATGAVAEPIAGLAGITQAVSPFAAPGAGARAVESTREALTAMPQTEAGQRALQTLGETLEPITSRIQAAERGFGEAGFRAAGPVGGAIGEAAITALEIPLAALGGRLAGQIRRVTRATPTREAQELLRVSAEADFPVLTSDILPPETFAAKSLQQLGEKLGPLGTGRKRAAQQRARQDVVVALADEFNVDLDSPLEADIVSSLKTKNAQEIAKAAEQRQRSVDVLTPLGDVPVPRSIVAIDGQLARQARLGERADQAFINLLQRTRNSLSGRDFSEIKDIRTEVISDLKAAGRSDDPRSAAALQSVKSAIDKDMIAFARRNNKTAAKDWLASNRKFAQEFENVKGTELKTILNKGDATPEKVAPILRGGKVSELNRLNASLTPKGKDAARAAIIRNALTESGFFGDVPNPDRLVNALRKPNTQKAVNVFFTGAKKKELDGLTRLLDSTRRAQQAAVATPTGQQLIPLAIGGGAVVDPFLTLFIAGTLAGVTRALESKSMRSILLKIANTKPGSAAERQLINAAATTAVALHQGLEGEQ
jgi:hypothetical protein